MPPLTSSDDPRLSMPCKEVSEQDIRCNTYAGLIKEMHQHLIHDPGIGIAAPQLGELIRLVAFEDTLERMAHLSDERRKLLDRHPHEFFLLFNPAITALSDEVTYYFEGCISFPGQVAVVKRLRHLRFEGLAANLRQIRSTASGWLARCMQHEIDHLDGITFLDRALNGSIMSVEEFKADWKDKTSDELQLAFAA